MDPREALIGYDRSHPEIIFLEVHMPQLSGIEFIHTLRTKTRGNLPRFVFVSDCDKYALSGYEQGVVDYLLKPVTFARFKLCTDKLFPSWFTQGSLAEEDFFFTEIDGRKMKIIYKDIYFIEGAGNYLIIYTRLGNFTLYKTLQSLLQILPDDQFVRIHKSFITSVFPIQEISGNEIVLFFQNKLRSLPIGPTYKESLMSRLTIV
jgi:DNA-binding LytR/AlgR family response regulator